MSGIYAPRWKALAADLGGARDWDVFLDETLAPLEEAFPGDSDLATIRRKGERAKAGAGKSAGSALTRMEYSQLLLAFSAALFRVKLSAVEGKGRASRLSLGKFAARRLEKRTDCIRLLLREHRKMNAEHRHDLRIEFKKLRYALEFFAPLISGKRLSAFQSSLSRIQDILGTLNDQVTASRLIKEMHPKGDEVPLTRGWIAGRSELLINALESELVKFSACKTPW